MTTATPTASTRATLIAIIATGVLVAGVSVLPSPALAGERGHGHGGGSKASSHEGRLVRAPVSAYATVPRIIHVEQRAYYRPYFAGRVFYAPHHHYHMSYRFPVYIGGAMLYRPYSYCGDALFVPGAVVLPHLAVGIGFGAPGGVAIGGYFATPVRLAPYPYLMPYPFPAPYAGAVVYAPPRQDPHHDDDEYDGD